MIRKAKLSEAPQISAIAVTVWTDTYATDGMREDFASYVTDEFSVSSIEKMITQHHVYVYESESKILGYAVVVNAFEDAPELITLYILPRFQRTGIGKLLFHYLDKQYAGLWLACWSENKSAITFYKKMGYSVLGEKDFVLDGIAYKNYVFSKTT